MSKHNKKYIQIIEKGRELFWKFGIKRVTIEEVCASAGVSKMTFYKFFTNKTDLVKHLIDDVFDENMNKYNKIMHTDKHFKDKVEEMALLKMKATQDISHEFINDYYTLFDEEMGGYLKIKMQENLDRMQNDFIDAQIKGDIRKDLKPEFIMYFLNHLSLMGQDPQLNSLYDNAQDMIMELMNFFFYGILPRSNTK